MKFVDDDDDDDDDDETIVKAFLMRNTNKNGREKGTQAPGGSVR